MDELNHEKMPLLEAMKNYGKRDVAAFDVPGHKRGKGASVLNTYFGDQLMRLDTNSLPSLDNVANPTGVIKEAQELLADAYGANVAFFMANGSTSAIHCMLMSVLMPGDQILIPKNIHKSALNGLILCGASPIYVMPELCKKEGLRKNVCPSAIEARLEEHPDIKAVFVLNPTYYGHTTDLKKVAKICHDRDVLLLVDEAHGAHFPFHPSLPDSAMECGADISCISVHKTGGALTQSSALLVNGERVDRAKVKQVINMLQSTSVSYLLMGSIDGARYNLVRNGKSQLTKALELVSYAKSKIEKIAGLRLICEAGEPARYYDPTKLGINVSGLGLTGYKVYEILWQKYDIQLETAEFNHILAIVSLGDCEKDLNRLIGALAEIAAEYDNPTARARKQLSFEIEIEPIVRMCPRDAYFSDKELVPIDESIGRISGESIMAYPPGIPVVSPGELVTEEMIKMLKDLQNSGAFIVDNFDPKLEKILVILRSCEYA
jgi:arginine decarboxylase